MEAQRVLVTGGNGFLGTYVVQKLQAQPWVQAVIAPGHAEYDLCKEEQAEQMYADHAPDVVVHLAASVGGIGANQREPATLFHQNILMGVHTMHHAYRSGVEKFVYVGTVCAYPKHTSVPFREDDLWNGYPEETNAPYGIAKKALLVQAQAYRQQYGFKTIYLLPANLYGPGDNFDPETSHVIPALIRKCIEAKDQGKSSLTLWGDGTPTREFLYAEDAAEGIVLATEAYDAPEPVNLGTGKEISIRDLASLIANETEFRGEIQWDTTKPNGQPRRCLDVTRAQDCFGFTAATPLEDGLRQTIAWFRQNRT